MAEELKMVTYATPPMEEHRKKKKKKKILRLTLGAGKRPAEILRGNHVLGGAWSPSGRSG